MSQRILKCTVCSGDHSIFHCENKCGVCHGDRRQCSCNERPPQKRKKISKSTASSQQPADTSHDDLKKKYESLQKDYKRVGQAFQNQQEQNQELTALLEEREKEAEYWKFFSLLRPHNVGRLGKDENFGVQTFLDKPICCTICLRDEVISVKFLFQHFFC